MMTFREAFSLHFSADSAAEDLNEHDLSAHPTVQAVLKELHENDLPTDGATLSIHGYGYGADAVAIGVTLTALTGLFLSGKKIEENLDAWFRLGARIRDAVKRLQHRGITASLSQPSATALALATTADGATDPNSVKLESVSVFPIENRSITQAVFGEFLEHPDRYYLFQLRRDETRLLVLCMSATGQILFEQSFSLDQFSYDRQ